MKIIIDKWVHVRPTKGQKYRLFYFVSFEIVQNKACMRPRDKDSSGNILWEVE